MKNQSENLEILSKEIIELNNSREYNLGRKIIYVLEKLKRLKFLEIINAYKISKLVCKTSVNNYQPNYITNSDKKIVVYTCITGNYDEVLDPMYKKNNISYVLFTNNKSLKSNVWEVRDIPEYLKELKNNVLINRYIKIKPHEIFKDYDYSIYIDGNIRIISDISGFVSTINKKSGLSFHRHRARNCIYEEGKACIYMGKGNKYKIKEQLKKYKEEGLPKEFGLLEANVIVTDLHSKKSIKILNDWYQEFILSESNRDQLSLPYVIWKNNLNISDIGNLGYNVRKNYYLQVKEHIK